MSPSLNLMKLCNVSSDFLGFLVLEQYIGNHSDFPEFRDDIFARLAGGPPTVKGVRRRAKWRGTRMTWWLGLLIALGVLVLVVLPCSFCVGRLTAAMHGTQ